METRNLAVAAHWMWGLRAVGVAIAIVGSALVGSEVASAHTTFKSQATEGLREDNAIRIGHGCDPDRPVVAQSVVFPTEAPVLAASDSKVSVSSLDEVIVGGSLAGLAQSIQDRSIFLVQDEKTDANGNVVGFEARAGRLDFELVGRVPFQFSAPSFVAASCVRRLLVRVAVADICSFRAPIVSPEKVNLWIPENGSRFAVEGAALGVEGIGEPPALVVNRDLARNPLAPACGTGFDLEVVPSAAQVDRDLPIGRYWLFRDAR